MNDDEWEIVEPQIDESIIKDDFDKQFTETETFKLLVKRYPLDYANRYEKWKKKCSNPNASDISLFRWQIMHKCLPTQE